LLEYWAKEMKEQDGFSTVSKDTRTLSLNVVADCGFRRSLDFETLSGDSSTTGTSSYRDALHIVLDHAILIMLIPLHYLRYSWLPRNMQVLDKTAAEFKLHMTRILRGDEHGGPRRER
jgi:hypothetical protein